MNGYYFYCLLFTLSKLKFLEQKEREIMNCTDTMDMDSAQRQQFHIQLIALSATMANVEVVICDLQNFI